MWKLPLIQLLPRLLGFEKIVFGQGLLGAESATSTTLLALNLPALPGELRWHAISADLPRGRSIGVDQHGNSRIAVLKSIPRLCAAQWLPVLPPFCNMHPFHRRMVGTHYP